MGRHKNVGRPRIHAKNWKKHASAGRPRRVGRPAGIHTKWSKGKKLKVYKTKSKYTWKK
jgi:hypothetical protein